MPNKNFIFAFVLIFLIGSVSSLSLDIQTKNSFKENEQVYFDYQVFSETEQEITFTPHILCNKNPIAPLQEQTIKVKGIYSGTYKDFLVDELIIQDMCTASVTITSPVNLKKEKTFFIDVKPKLEFNIITCKDANCNKKSKVFLKGEKIFIKVDNNLISSTDLVGNYKQQNKDKKSLSFSNGASEIKTKNAGSYEIELTFENENYKTTTAKTQISVIDKIPNIQGVKENKKGNFITKIVERIKGIFS